MSDRALLFLLAVTVWYVFGVKPHAEGLSAIKARIAAVDLQIAGQRDLHTQQAAIERLVNAAMQNAHHNRGLLFDETSSTSLDMVTIQDNVKMLAIETKLEVVSTTWGEPARDQKSPIVRLPITCIMRGTPTDINAFLKQLLYGKRLVKIERASLTRNQGQQLLLNCTIIAFKLDRTNAG